MISKLIYDYFKLNTISTYSKCLFNARKIIINETLLTDTLSNLIFKNDWYNKLNKKIEYSDFKFSITSIEPFSNFLRVYVTRSRIFNFNATEKILHKSNNENFIFIISKEKNNYYIHSVAYKEENLCFYEKLATSSLDSLSSSRTIKNFIELTNSGEFIWTKNLNDLNILYDSYIKRIIPKYPIKLAVENYSTLINCDYLIKYARKYALNYNKKFTNFNQSGGDCTNFISQALNFAGLKKSPLWEPYTAAWIMVVPLYNYLIKNNLSTEYDEICPYPVGTIIQFFSPIKNRFSHSGIITSMMKNGELLYCCHDYDKLDFPLSETYPIFYQRIRTLKIK